MEEEIQLLRDYCTSIRNKAKDLCELFESQPFLEEWQISGCKHLLNELNSKLDLIHETLTNPKTKQKRKGWAVR